MWGTLRNTIANAATTGDESQEEEQGQQQRPMAGFIAKLGDVVAPQAFSDEEEYEEYETDSEEEYYVDDDGNKNNRDYYEEEEELDFNVQQQGQKNTTFNKTTADDLAADDDDAWTDDDLDDVDIVSESDMENNTVSLPIVNITRNETSQPILMNKDTFEATKQQINNNTTTTIKINEEETEQKSTTSSSTIQWSLESVQRLKEQDLQQYHHQQQKQDNTINSAVDTIDETVVENDNYNNDTKLIYDDNNHNEIHSNNCTIGDNNSDNLLSEDDDTIEKKEFNKNEEEGTVKNSQEEEEKDYDTNVTKPIEDDDEAEVVKESMGDDEEEDHDTISILEDDKKQVIHKTMEDQEEEDHDTISIVEDDKKQVSHETMEDQEEEQETTSNDQDSDELSTNQRSNTSKKDEEERITNVDLESTNDDILVEEQELNEPSLLSKENTNEEQSEVTTTTITDATWNKPIVEYDGDDLQAHEDMNGPTTHGHSLLSNNSTNEEEPSELTTTIITDNISKEVVVKDDVGNLKDHEEVNGLTTHDPNTYTSILSEDIQQESNTSTSKDITTCNYLSSSSETDSTADMVTEDIQKESKNATSISKDISAIDSTPQKMEKEFIENDSGIITTTSPTTTTITAAATTANPNNHFSSSVPVVNNNIIQELENERDELQSDLKKALNKIATLQSESFKKQQNEEEKINKLEQMYDTKQQQEIQKQKLENEKSLNDTKQALRNELKEYHDREIMVLKETHTIAMEAMTVKITEEKEEMMNRTMEQIQIDMDQTIQGLQQRISNQKEEYEQKVIETTNTIETLTTQMENVDMDKKSTVMQLENELSHVKKIHSSSMDKLETKTSRALHTLQEKDIEIRELHGVIEDMKRTIKENVENAEEVEDEADELHHENEELKIKMEEIKNETMQLKQKNTKLQKDNDDLMGIQMELRLVKEERQRQKDEMEVMIQAQTSNEGNIIAERDAAKAEVVDIDQRLTALQADFDVVKADYERSITANTNLQRAMEAFQMERETEISLFEESKISSEEAIIASHMLALESMKQENTKLMKDVQTASNKAITKMMNELKLMEDKVEEYRKDNVNLRRSLDEAIYQLQTNQEDVIDRSLMKNILLEWHTRKGGSKSKREVMHIMASVLHFNGDEKKKCGIGEESVVGSGTIGMVVDAVAPPLNPAVKNSEDIEGDTVREKWVNFLIAECGDDNDRNDKKKGKTITGEVGEDIAGTSTSTKINTSSTVVMKHSKRASSRRSTEATTL